MKQVWADDITAHYPPTLAAWRERFFAAWERLREGGYDERFRRLWDFYLSSSEAGFRERRIDAVGVETMVLAPTPDGWKIRHIHWSSR